MGSCNEVNVVLDLAYDLGYLSNEVHRELSERYDQWDVRSISSFKFGNDFFKPPTSNLELLDLVGEHCVWS